MALEVVVAAGLMPGGAAWERWREHHALAFALLTLLAVGVAAVLPTPSLVVQLAGLAVLVAFFGVPHGALDSKLGSELFRPRLGRAWWIPFGVVYLVLAGSFLAAWTVAPALSLLAFLVGSVFHFGVTDLEPGLTPRRARGIAIALRGGLPIVLPALFHGEEFATVLALLLPGASLGEVSGAVRGASLVLGPVLLVGLAGLALFHLRRALRERSTRQAGVVLEIGSLTVASATLPPLVFFVFYFCAGHSLRHMLSLGERSRRPDPGRALVALWREALPLSAATLVVGTGWLLLGAPGGLEPALARVVFIGLAALTVPHMVLTSLAAQPNALPVGKCAAARSSKEEIVHPSSTRSRNQAGEGLPTNRPAKRPTGPMAPERLPDLIQITSCLARLGCGEEEIWRIVTSWSDSPRSPVVRQVRENPDLSRTLAGAAA